MNKPFKFFKVEDFNLEVPFGMTYQEFVSGTANRLLNEKGIRVTQDYPNAGWITGDDTGEMQEALIVCPRPIEKEEACKHVNGWYHIDVNKATDVRKLVHMCPECKEIIDEKVKNNG